MTTDNAPERIELGGGYWFEPNPFNRKKMRLFHPSGEIFSGVDVTVQNAKLLYAAMQPIPSESDEAVARELITALGSVPPEGKNAVEVMLPILARHRQPAAVSADAVELADKLKIEAITDGYQDDNYIEGCWDSDKVEALCQAYGDACRLDGARKGLTAAGNAAHECGYYSQAYVDDEPPMEVVHHNTGVWKARDAIRALSPETVCGGE